MDGKILQLHTLRRTKKFREREAYFEKNEEYNRPYSYIGRWSHIIIDL